MFPVNTNEEYYILFYKVVVKKYRKKLNYRGYINMY